MQFFEIDNRKVTMAVNAMRWQLDHQPLPVAVRLGLGLGLISLMSARLRLGATAMAPSDRLRPNFSQGGLEWGRPI